MAPRLLSGGREVRPFDPYGIAGFARADPRHQAVREQGTQRFVSGEDFFRYVTDAFDWLWREGQQAPKMLSLGLHLRMIGRPGRMAGLERALEHMQKRGAVWFARRDQIARHWIERFGAEG